MMIESSSLESPLKDKCSALETALADRNSIAVAYSGGVDSTFLTWFIQDVLEKKVVAILALSSFVSRREQRDAVDLAHRLKLPLETVVIEPLDIPSVRENGTMRCYYCKREIMSLVVRRAGELGFSLVADGTHAGDTGTYRPGKRALMELGIESPLATAGLTKSDIRRISRNVGLPTWDKPSQSCLATRVPYDTVITPEILSSIERAEEFLWDLGCKQVRVRYHGPLARIEVSPDSFPLLMEERAREAILGRLTELGFRYVSLDLAGYRSGSWD